MGLEAPFICSPIFSLGFDEVAMDCSVLEEGREAGRLGGVGLETDEGDTSEIVAEELCPPSEGGVTRRQRKAMARRTASERKTPLTTKPLSPKLGTLAGPFGCVVRACQNSSTLWNR